jgi:Fic family protein
MKAVDFVAGFPGTLAPAEPSGYAFVPSPIPPKGLPLDFELVTRLSDADVALTMLEGLAHRFPDPEVLLHPFLLKEAVDSGRIEGTQTTYSDILLFEAASASVKRSADPDTKVTRNYISALNYGVDALKTLPISRRLICATHKILMSGYNERLSRPGQIRTGQVLIGQKADTPETARFVPPPARELNFLISDFEIYCNNYRDMPLLLRAAIMHYQFETIHPFWDVATVASVVF